MSSRAQTIETSRLGKPLSEWIRRVLKHVALAKLSLCYLMTASAFTAYVVRRPALDAGALEITFSLFLLCLGAATLNNYQDRGIDRQLRRTRARPLALGEVAPQAALMQAGALMMAGTTGLFLLCDSPTPSIAGLVAVLLYNGLYTPLKKRTYLAIIPGAVCGTLPVLIGWMAAGGGGGLESPKLWLLMVVFGVWQLPHSWLVVLRYRGDYESPGIPSMLQVFSVGQLRRLVCVWVADFLLLTLCLPLYRVIVSDIGAWVLLGNALILAAVFGVSLRGDGGRYPAMFRYLNLSLAVVMGVIMVEGIAVA